MARAHIAIRSPREGFITNHRAKSTLSETSGVARLTPGRSWAYSPTRRMRHVPRETPSRLLKKALVWLEDGLVAVVIDEFDLDGAVIEQFVGAVAGDFVHFVEALPGEADQ
jgi:hypothetical protein